MSREIEAKFFVPAERGSIFDSARANKSRIVERANELLKSKGIQLDPTVEDHFQKKYRPYIYFDLKGMQFYNIGISFSVRYKGRKGFGFTVKIPTDQGTEERIEFDDTKSADFFNKEVAAEEKALSVMLDFKSRDYKKFEHKEEKIIHKFVAHLREALEDEESEIKKRLKSKGLTISNRTLDQLGAFEDDFLEKSLRKVIFNVYLETCDFKLNGKAMGYFTFDQVMDESGKVLFYEAEVEIKEKSEKHLEIYKALKKAFEEHLKGAVVKGEDLTKYQRVVQMIHKK